MAQANQRQPGYLPREFLNNLTERVDGPAFIGRYLKVNLHGDRHFAVCPFHQDSKPSFLIRRDGSFYCFGCHKKGSVFNFLMEHSGSSFVEAVTEVAQSVGVPMPARSGRAGPSKEEQALYDVLEDCASFFEQQLVSAKQDSLVKQYIQKRDISQEIIEKYRIGFAPKEWDGLRQHFTATNEQLLIDADVLVRHKEKQHVYDRYRNRLMFPIRNRQGNMVGFGGRVLNDADNPKYLNTKQTRVFHKSRELYGLYEVLNETRRPERLLLVEGYTDVVGLSQNGIPYAVASLGTASNDTHFKTMFWFTDEVVCCFDGDDAGRTAAQRALESALPALTTEKAVRFLFLPDGEDPDSFVRTQGKSAFEQLIDDAQNAADYFVETLVENKNRTFETIEEKVNFVESAKSLIQRVGNDTMRHVLAQEVANCFPDQVNLDSLLTVSQSQNDYEPPLDDIPPPEEDDFRYEVEPHPEIDRTSILINEIHTRRRISQLLSAPNIWPLLSEHADLFQRLVEVAPNHPLTRIWIAIDRFQFRDVNALIASFQTDEWFTHVLVDIHNDTVAEAMIETSDALAQFTDSIQTFLTVQRAQIERRTELGMLRQQPTEDSEPATGAET